MTIAHEVGHMIMGHRGVLNRGPIAELDRGYGSTARAEYQANIFAAALLVPLHATVKVMTVDEIMKQFRVSKQAATIRLKQVKSLIP